MGQRRFGEVFVGFGGLYVWYFNPNKEERNIREGVSCLVLFKIRSIHNLLFLITGIRANVRYVLKDHDSRHNTYHNLPR